jgi:hypothetical protein
MSDGHIYLISFGGQPTRFLIPHLIPSPLFAVPSAGAVDKLLLPEGMQEVRFFNCWGLTGTAESRMSEGHIYSSSSSSGSRFNALFVFFSATITRRV